MNPIFQAVAGALRAQGQIQLAALVERGDAIAQQICAQYTNGGSAPALPASYGAQFNTSAGNGGGCGCGCNGKNGGGSCGINNGCGSSPNSADSCGVPGLFPPPPGSTPIPASSGCPLPPSAVPTCSQVGLWNCQTVDLDLAPCDIQRIQREEKLVTIAGETINGPINAGTDIFVLLAPVGVAHDLCVDYLLVEVLDDQGVATTVAINVIEMQAERVYQNGDGSYVHAWDFGDPERPTYLGITDGRCQCFTLCNCTAAQGHLRLKFPLPVAVANGGRLRVTVWGRRCSWQKSCGPCPPCMICDRTALTETEQTSDTDIVYAGT